MALAGAYLLLEDHGGEFVIDCLTGFIHGACDGNNSNFDWYGSDEMEPANGDGWAELQEAGSLEGEIFLLNGGDIPFIACRTKTSSTACSHHCGVEES